MPKCSVCQNKVEETFLGKIRGTFVKKEVVCSSCQSKQSKESKE
jgi:hypothetical protein